MIKLFWKQKKLLKKCETKKLHYGRYLYKVVVRSPLASVFRTEMQRNGKLSHARSQIDSYKLSAKLGLPLKKTTWRSELPLDSNDIRDADKICRLLLHSKDYLVRCEYNTLIIYSNDKKLLITISQFSIADEFWEPDTNCITFLQKNTNIIISDTKPDFPFKLTFGQKPASRAMGTWLQNNTDKSRCGPLLLKNFLNGERWIKGQYIFVRDEKVLFMVQLICGDNITRIDKIVYKDDIDK